LIVDRVGGVVQLPDNLKILSWNYDSQIEKAFFPYWGRSGGLFEVLQAYPIHYRRDYDIDPGKFCVIRLNGLAGLHIAEGTKIGRPYNLFSITTQEEAMQPLVTMYDQYLSGVEDIYPLLDFAWDEDCFTEKFRAVAKKEPRLLMYWW
jgi:hypothetical protein